MTEAGGIDGGGERETGKEGVLVPLKTTLEVGARERVIEVWITSVDAKMASKALDVVRRVLPDDGGLDLAHLRRFVKFVDVPPHVRELFGGPEDEAIAIGRYPAGQLQEELEIAMAEGTNGAVEEVPKLVSANLDKRLLVIGSINAITKSAMEESLSPLISNPPIFSISVPLLAPTSKQQAESWSSKYWPTVYKKNNPFGPHPSIVSRAADEIRGETAKWMGLATEVARQAKERGLGEAVGVVIVERKDGVARPVALAGDGRWACWPRRGAGNVTAHAVMRGIAMVAEGLRKRDIPAAANSEDSTKEPTIFQDDPLLPVEEEYLDTTGNEDGYLCNNLEIYCTHEPCVMCSMAIVHSRFGRLVFGKRMNGTGGICADGELGHGLFWRKELNWTLLAWQWDQGADSEDVVLDLNA